MTPPVQGVTVFLAGDCGECGGAPDAKRCQICAKTLRKDHDELTVERNHLFSIAKLAAPLAVETLDRKLAQEVPPLGHQERRRLVARKHRLETWRERSEVECGAEPWEEALGEGEEDPS